MAILRSLFGPSREEMWQKLSDDVSGRFFAGGFGGTTKVEVSVGEWTITLDTYTRGSGHPYITFTRLRAPFINRDGFRFKVFKKGFFSSIGKAFGMQDVTVGNPLFDKYFIIQGNNEDHLRKLFQSEEIRGTLMGQINPFLEVKDDEGWFGSHFPEGVDELCFSTQREIKEIEHLKSLFDLFAEVLDELCQMGSAYGDDPNVTLK